MTCRAAIELHPRGTLRSSPERITARACAAPTRRKEAVSFPFPAAERRKKFIVGGREENLQGKLKLALGQEKRTWERHLTKVLIINA